MFDHARKEYAMRVQLSSLTRRAAVVTAIAGAFALASCGGGGGGKAEGDMAVGAAEGAKVTVIEYASVACHACAAWNDSVWPEFKTKYVDNNKVRYVFREMITGDPNVASAGFLLARCAGPDKYFDVVHAILESQAEWATGTPPRDSLLRIASSVGIDNQEFLTCVSDEQALAELSDRNSAAAARGVTGTPTFYVNDKKITDASLSGLSKAIDEALAE